MTVFKGFLLLLKRDAKSVSLYLVIFIAIAVMTQLSMGIINQHLPSKA
ncbi:hypothetical protein RyT2_27880 [Pseudolactococcus yaeyamensis]